MGEFCPKSLYAKHKENKKTKEEKEVPLKPLLPFWKFQYLPNESFEGS